MLRVLSLFDVYILNASSNAIKCVYALMKYLQAEKGKKMDGCLLKFQTKLIQRKNRSWIFSSFEFNFAIERERDIFRIKIHHSFERLSFGFSLVLFVAFKKRKKNNISIETLWTVDGILSQWSASLRVIGLF